MSPRLLPLLVATILSAGCRPKDAPLPEPPKGEPARRSAAAFVHCVEAGGSGCVRGSEGQAAWDAFQLLGFLASGSPVAILQVLPRELTEHGDLRQVQARLVAEIERYQASIRGAECDPVGVQELQVLVGQVAEAARTRMEALGLWSEDMRGVVEGLAGEAGEGLRDGFLVAMRCHGDPFQLYLATTKSGERQIVIGLATVLPRFLGGQAPDRAATTARLASRSLGYAGTRPPLVEGVVDSRWIPIPVEEF